MASIKTILFPTDFSECAEQALDQALVLANELDAQLHLLHVIVLHASDPYNPAFHFRDLGDIEARLEQIASTEMSKTLGARGSRLEIVQAHERGVAAGSVILDYAQKHAVDLIIMGTHGRRGLRRFALGSVTEEVMRVADCPVLTIRQREQARSFGEVSRVLVPVDYSENSMAALMQAKRLVDRFGGQLDLVHVIEGRHIAGFYSAIGEQSVHHPEKLHSMAGAKLRSSTAEVLGGATPCAHHTAIGRSVAEILRIAEQVGSDLIVMGSQGGDDVDHRFFGSTAEGIVRRSEVPVLIVKPTPTESRV